MKIDVIVLLHPKDQQLVKYCINGIRKYIDFNRIIIISKSSLNLTLGFNDLIFMDEDKVIDGLTYSLYQDKGPRWGWYFQQILKLGMAEKVETDYYLTVDADTVFLRKVTFFNENDKPLYDTSKAYHKPYFFFFKELLGFDARREFSFITHHMVFNKDIVLEMRNRFLKKKIWYDRIVDCVDSPNSFSLFSEFETYGHYLKQFYPGELNIRKLNWANMPIAPTNTNLTQLSKYYDFCSFHEFLRENKAKHKELKRKLEYQWIIFMASLFSHCKK